MTVVVDCKFNRQLDEDEVSVRRYVLPERTLFLNYVVIRKIRLKHH